MKQLNLKLMTKSGGRPTFLGLIEEDAMKGADGRVKYLWIPTTIWSQLMAHLKAGSYCLSSIIKGVLFIPAHHFWVGRETSEDSWALLLRDLSFSSVLGSPRLCSLGLWPASLSIQVAN